jgi:uncharacterized protein (DUF2249 family)
MEPPQSVQTLDVRPVLARGEDPYALVMGAAAAVAEGGELVVDAPFNPAPLRRVLARQGFSSTGRKLAEGHWRILFRRDANAEGERDVEVLPEGAMTWREDDGLHIDVRKLPPPLPMLAILRVIDGLDADQDGDVPVVVVHHEREPHFLAPELAERGWQIARMTKEFVNIRLWLERSS